MRRNNASTINGKVLWNTKLYMAYCQGKSSFDNCSNTAVSVTILCHALGSTLLCDSKTDSISAVQCRRDIVSEQGSEVGKAAGLIIVLWTWKLPSCWSSKVWEHQGPGGFFALSLQICVWPVGISHQLRVRGQGHPLWRARSGTHLKNTGCQRLLWPLRCSLLMEELFLALLPKHCRSQCHLVVSLTWS